MIMNVGEDASDLVGHAFLCQVIWNDHTMTSGSATSATSVHSAGTLLSLAAGCGVLIALVIASFVIILWVRRRSLTAHNDAVEGFSFRDMESMVERGLITEDEYKQIKRARALKMAKRLSGDSP